MMAKSRWRRLRGIVLVNFGVLIGLYLVAEIALHIVSSNSNPLFRLTAKTGIGIRDPVYHHTLRPKFDGFDKWGNKDYPFVIAGCANLARLVRRKVQTIFRSFPGVL